jgi:pimeloyl-ACP methyl ester carboxylesterase
MIDHTTPIIILHGLGNRAWTMILFEWYLNWCGYTNTFRPLYDANALPMNSSREVNRKLLDHFKGRQNHTVVIVGNSMGGVVGAEMHKFGWDVKLLITINSPLNGASFLHQLDGAFPTRLVEVCGGDSTIYNYLRRKPPAAIPPHPYKTISTNLPFMQFDGMVYQQDAMIEPKHHSIIPWGSHHTVVLDPRVYFEVVQIIKSQ